VSIVELDSPHDGDQGIMLQSTNVLQKEVERLRLEVALASRGLLVSREAIGSSIPVLPE
jgi:hypothetical protein